MLSSRTRFCQKKKEKEAIDVRDANPLVRSLSLCSQYNYRLFSSLLSRSACLHLCLVVVVAEHEDDDGGGDVEDFPPSPLSLSPSSFCTYVKRKTREERTRAKDRERERERDVDEQCTSLFSIGQSPQKFCVLTDRQTMFE